MKTAKILSFTTLVAMVMGACAVSLAEEVKDSSTTTEIVSVEETNLRNEDALRVAVGDFDDVEFLLSAEEMEAIADNVYISFNGVSTKGGEGSGSSISSAEASGQVETTENSSTTFSGALTLASATSEMVTTSVSSVAMSLSSDKSTEQYAVDAGKSYYEQVSTSNSGSAVTTYSATSFLGNSNSVGDGNGGYGISTLAGIIEDPVIGGGDLTPTVTDRKWVGGAGTIGVGSASYNWSTGANWDSGSWSNGDSATFDATGSNYSTVTVDTEIIVTDLTVSGDYTFEYSTGASLTVTGTAIISGSSDADLLTITGGTTTFNGDDYTYVGDLGGKGAITILGSDTVVKFETGLILGFGFAVSIENVSEGELIIGSLEDTGDGPYVTFETDTLGTTEIHVGGGPNNTGKITINSGTTIFDTAVYLAYGYGSTGTIEINGGTNTFYNDVYLGWDEGSTGTITINGGTNTFTGEVDVGFYGDGYVTISGGTNTFNGDTWVGCWGTGEITITDGKNTFSGDTYVGYACDGYVTISGGENTFSGYTYVGYEDNGTITINGGENTFNNNVYVSYTNSSTGTITIEGGETIFNGQYTYVGYEGTGSLTITGGTTTFSGKYTEVGYKGTGEMTISGDDTVVRFDGSQVYVGDGVDSIGTLTINGGTTTFGDKVYVGYSNNSAGTLTINGGTTTFGDNVYIGHNNGSTGTITITGGSTTIRGATTIENNNCSLSVSGGTLTIEKKIGTSQTGSVTFSDSGKLIVTQTLLATAAGELKEGETAAVAVITANTITFGSTTLDYLDSSDSGYVTDLVSSYITVQSGKYRVIDWYYYADNGTLYAIVILPEPSMFGMLFGLSALGLVSTRRRRRKA